MNKVLTMKSHTFWIFFAVYLWCQVSSSSRQMRLSNKHLRMGAVPFPPFLVRNRDTNAQDTYSGILWDLVEYIQKARNCTFTVVIPPDMSWGNCYDNNTCTGMIGLVNRSEVDFAIGMYHTLTRKMWLLTSITFTHEYFQGPSPQL